MHTLNTIKNTVNKIAIVDTHEHLMPPHDATARKRIDFGVLFTHYASSDLISAGMPPEDVRILNSVFSDDWPPRRKWQLTAPYYELTRNTTYMRVLRTSVHDLYNINDLSQDTVDELSSKINAANHPGRIREVFNLANIDVAMNQWWDHPITSRKPYPDIFIYDMTDGFSSMKKLDALKEDSQMDVSCLEDYLGLIDFYFEKYAQVSGAFKISRAYDRPIFFDEVEKSEAARIMDRFLENKTGDTPNGLRPLEDYIVHYLINRCIEYRLPIKVHTGLQEGNSGDITHSRASLLINLFQKYPDARFDIYHASWPYADELTAICKTWPNVWIDFCWLWAISPGAASRHLAEMLDTIPANKIHGFGGDYIFPEGVYGQSIVARNEISRVLSEKVENGIFSEDYAIETATRLLRTNALTNFDLEHKHNLSST